MDPARVAEGEADAGIVYVTDVTPEVRTRVLGVAIPDHLNVTADYAIGCIGAGGRSDNSGTGRSFISVVLSPAGQSILERWGFRRAANTGSNDEEEIA